MSRSVIASFATDAVRDVCGRRSALREARRFPRAPFAANPVTGRDDESLDKDRIKKRLLRLTPQNYINPREHKLRLRCGKPSRPLGENRLVEGDDLGDVRH